MATGSLSAILRFYRTIHGMNQTALGDLLGYDKTTISALELGKRTLSDIPSRRRIAALLHLPAHVLGVTDPGDTDHRAMLQFGESTVRLAETARQSGHASEAVAELWPLVARLEARDQAGATERDLRLLARARVGLGVALGNVLPEERLATAARWTARSLHIAQYLDDPGLMSYVLRMHGNELRKARLRGAAVERLRHAVALAPTRDDRAAALPLLARAAGEAKEAALFDAVMRECHGLLDDVEHTSLFNPYALHEIRLRGLVATGRADAAIPLAEHGAPLSSSAAAPQWRVISSVTAGHVRLLADDRSGAVETLSLAVHEAFRQRLPHQLQRVMRTADGPRLREVYGRAEQALARLRAEMAA